MLKFSGASVGGLLLGNSLNSAGSSFSASEYDPAQSNSLFDSLPEFTPGEKLDPDEMRITFLGTSCIPRLSQECNSVYIEVGSGDQFVFDCGTGVSAKYNALGVPMSKMNKIFLTHLHADHTSDLTHIYCFGPAEDRKSPLFIFGPKDSGFVYHDPDGNRRGPYLDGTKAFCERLREMNRWHTESFSFGPTSYPDYQKIKPTQLSWGLPVPPIPVADDSDDDGYAIIPIELEWRNSGRHPYDNIAYHNQETGVTITHFPAIHTRQGSVSYKLTWNNMSVIFTGDTKPNQDVIEQAKGVDVLIHEMVMPAYVWAAKNSGLPPTDPDFIKAYDYALQVQNSSHTPQGAFGYLMSQIEPAPRLTVATHFQAEDDTIFSATQSVRNHVPTGELTFAADFMVLNVSKERILQRRAVVSPYAFYPVSPPQTNTNSPKYWKWNNPDIKDFAVPDPTAQIDPAREVPQTNPETGQANYRIDGY